MRARKLVKWIVIVGAVFQFAVWNMTTTALLPGASTPEPASTPTPRAAAPTSAPAAPPAPPSPHADPKSALGVAQALEVRDRDRVDYKRVKFGQPWADVDRNGCDTRNDVLRRDLVKRHTKPGTRGCVLAAGVLDTEDDWSYAAEDVKFTRGDGDIEVDHVVPLADAWRAGAYGWDDDKRRKFANDAMELESLDTESNRDKGDKTFNRWRPDDELAACQYALRIVTVKHHYELTVTEKEKSALLGMLSQEVDRDGLDGCTEFGGLDPLPKASAFKWPKPRPIGEPKPQPTPQQTTPKHTTPKQSSRVVHPGAFCSPAGAHGVTASGTAMVCKSTSSDPRNRWRRG